MRASTVNPPIPKSNRAVRAAHDTVIIIAHSTRRTTVPLIYKKTGTLRACQLLLEHSKLEITVRYLGVDIEDAISLSEGIDI